MKIFIDTNIFLDLLLQREYYKEAVKILNAVDKGIFNGVILDITLLNIFYIAKKQHSNIKEFLKLINSIFLVKGSTNQEFSKALKVDNFDIEDNLQYITAKESGCDIIISNDKSFYSKDIELLSSQDFVVKYINKI